ncbi:formate dehydrogenase accessory protein FdhE [Aquitalea pelogenes]|uniref:formate dehydrogenase accessory protein FdhE n=1 Tax=Aquitalea pelogenes TaxID=1293573 RepID=UPI0007888235|nr:formate dehydrogenase accessory protein FdhE [Aquitalea pelogenes]
MSIRIVPAEQLAERQAASLDITPLLLPQPATLYRQRAERLQQLAAGHVMADYLQLASRIAEAQHQLVHSQPVLLPVREDYFRHCAEHGLPPLGAMAWQRDSQWQQLLLALCAQLAEGASPLLAGVLNGLLDSAPAQLEAAAQKLLSGDLAAVDSAQAPFIWAALSVYFSQLASQLQIAAVAEPGDARHLCPVCASAPVASIVRQGNEAGLRYLHCSLCESEWHLVRAKCSNCEATRDIGYWSLQDAHAAVRGESCGDCGSYLKILSLDKDQQAEAVADDLASLALDAALEEQGFARSGLNPLLFPGNTA